MSTFREFDSEVGSALHGCSLDAVRPPDDSESPRGVNGSPVTRNHRKNGIALIDECALRRDCTLGLLRVHFRDATRCFIDTNEFLDQLVPSSSGPRGIILGIGMRAVADAAILSQLRSIAERAGSAPLMLLADRDDSAEHLVMAFREGVRGYIPTTLEPCLVIGAIKLVLGGGRFIPAETVIRRGLRSPASGDLSAGGERPHDPPVCKDGMSTQWPEPYRSIVAFVLQGRTNKEIGQLLRLEENTVKTYVRQIMRKTGVINRTQLAIVVHRQQLALWTA